MGRTDFPVRFLADLEGWTVKDPAQAVFYLVSLLHFWGPLGPVEVRFRRSRSAYGSPLTAFNLSIHMMAAAFCKL